MRLKFILAAAVCALAGANAAAADVHEGLGEYPFGKRIDEVRKLLTEDNAEVIDVCDNAALRKLYYQNGVSCDALISREPVKIGELLFYPEFSFQRWGDRALVAVIYRSHHRFTSKKKRDLEMGADELVAAAGDRDYMIARTNTFKTLGDSSKLMGRHQATMRPGLRVIKYYFEGEKDYMVFREHTTEVDDRITLLALPKNTDEERRVFLSESEEKRFFSNNR